MAKAGTLIFIAPRRVEIHKIPLPPLKKEEVLVETLYSAASAGTETPVYRGEFPQLQDARGALSGNLKYPLKFERGD